MGARWVGLGQARPGGSRAGLLPYSHVISSLFWTGGVEGQRHRQVGVIEHLTVEEL